MSDPSAQNDSKLHVAMVGLAISSAALALLDFVYEKHPHVKFEGWFNFYGFFAALTTLSIIAIAILARSVLARKEDYYDG
jgi:hypothetical protein